MECVVVWGWNLDFEKKRESDRQTDRDRGGRQFWDVGLEKDRENTINGQNEELGGSQNEEWEQNLDWRYISGNGTLTVTEGKKEKWGENERD